MCVCVCVCVCVCMCESVWIASVSDYFTVTSIQLPFTGDVKIKFIQRTPTTFPISKLTQIVTILIQT